MTIAPRAASTTEPMPRPTSRSGASCQRCWVRQCNRHPASEPPRKIRRLGRPGPGRFPLRPAAPALRRRESSLSRRPPQMPAVGDLAGSLMGTGAVSPSSRHQRSSCKKARSGMAVVDVSLDRIPRKKDCQFRMGEIPCGKGAEPIDRRDRLGRGTRRLHAPITLPDCIRPLLESGSQGR